MGGDGAVIVIGRVTGLGQGLVGRAFGGLLLLCIRGTLRSNRQTLVGEVIEVLGLSTRYIIKG